MTKSARTFTYVSAAARTATCLAAMLVLTAAPVRAVAQQPASTATSHMAQARARTPTPTTIPHTQPASRPQAGPQRGAPKPTVVLKPGEEPAISFEEPTWEFGRQRAGADLTHEFVFTNTGTGPLEILEVKPG